MAQIDIFQGAKRLEGVHPFVLLTCLLSNNQTVTPALQFDEELVPLAAEWLGATMRGAQLPAPRATTLGGTAPEPREVPERLDALQRILRRLRNNGYFGGRHTPEANFATGIAGHLLGFAANARDRLITLGILEGKGTTSGKHIWLNERRLAEIDEILAGRVRDDRLRKLCEADL